MILILQLKKLTLWKSQKLSKVTQYSISTPDLGYRSKGEFQHTCFIPDPHTFYGKERSRTSYWVLARKCNLSEPQFTQINLGMSILIGLF